MTNEQREAIKICEHYKNILYACNYEKGPERTGQAIETVLSLIKEQEEEIENYKTLYERALLDLIKADKQIYLIKQYAHQEIVHCTETIKDYIDDDKEGNKDYIGQLKEEREHWKDIEKILQNKPKEELYMNWWRYGLYE